MKGRYAQFCPLARSAEVIGERWTLLVLRELLSGPQRFTDLLRRLRGMSSSVLSARLAELEERGLIERRVLDPPAASTIYELTENGRALRPALMELARWGLRLLSVPQPGDQIEPDWVCMGLEAFARRSATPGRSFEIRMRDGQRPVALRVEGGEGGTQVGRVGPPADVCITAEPLAVLGLASGSLQADDANIRGSIEVEGDATALADFPLLFDMSVPEPGPPEAGKGGRSSPQDAETNP